MSHSCRGRVIAYGYLIRKGARKEHLDYIYKGLMSHYQRAKLICGTPPRGSQCSKQVKTKGIREREHPLRK